MAEMNKKCSYKKQMSQAGSSGQYDVLLKFSSRCHAKLAVIDP